LRVFPPVFNCYETGQTFGNHMDNAIRQAGNSTYRVRADISQLTGVYHNLLRRWADV